MKMLIAAVASATAIAASSFAQSNNLWAWKGASAAPADATSAYTAYAASPSRRGRVVVSEPGYAGAYKPFTASPASRSPGNNGYWPSRSFTSW
jgi:hypothetical protein